MEVNKMHWINIKDKVPTDDSNDRDAYNCVLVYSSFNGSIAFAQYLENKWILYTDGYYSDGGGIGLDEDDITHWMTMPTPPKD